MAKGRSASELVLYVIDDDSAVCEALCRLALVAGFRAHAFTSVEQFVTRLDREGKGCVLLDSSLIGSGCALKEAMRRRGLDWPMIVLCAGADAAARQKARAIGAHFLLNKPVDAQALFDSIAWVTDEEN